MSAKQLTMVNAVHLLLFGSNSVISQNGIITMDNWYVTILARKLVTNYILLICSYNYCLEFGSYFLPYINCI